MWAEYSLALGITVSSGVRDEVRDELDWSRQLLRSGSFHEMITGRLLHLKLHACISCTSNKILLFSKETDQWRVAWVHGAISTGYLSDSRSFCLLSTCMCGFVRASPSGFIPHEPVKVNSLWMGIRTCDNLSWTGFPSRLYSRDQRSWNRLWIYCDPDPNKAPTEDKLII